MVQASGFQVYGDFKDVPKYIYTYRYICRQTELVLWFIITINNNNNNSGKHTHTLFRSTLTLLMDTQTWQVTFPEVHTYIDFISVIHQLLYYEIASMCFYYLLPW